MRADICEPNEVARMTQFSLVLESLKAEKINHNWAIGVDHWQYRVGEDILSVFADSWSVDVEGPDELVNRIISAMK